MEPPEWEAEPVAEVLGLAVTLVPELPLIVPVLPPPPAPPVCPMNPPFEALRAISGAGAECGAIMAWGMELSRVPCGCVVEALGACRNAGTLATRASEAGADWTMDLEFAGPLARTVAFVHCFVGALKLGDGAAAASRLIPPRARGMRVPAPIAPFAPCPARITVDGSAAS